MYEVVSVRENVMRPSNPCIHWLLSPPDVVTAQREAVAREEEEKVETQRLRARLEV